VYLVACKSDVRSIFLLLQVSFVCSKQQKTTLASCGAIYILRCRYNILVDVIDVKTFYVFNKSFKNVLCVFIFCAFYCRVFVVLKTSTQKINMMHFWRFSFLSITNYTETKLANIEWEK